MCYEGPFSEEELPSATPARTTIKVEQRSGLKSNAKVASARRGASDGRWSKETMAQVHLPVASVFPTTEHCLWVHKEGCLGTHSAVQLSAGRKPISGHL